MGQMAMGLTQHLMSQMTLRQEARLETEEKIRAAGPIAEAEAAAKAKYDPWTKMVSSMVERQGQGGQGDFYVDTVSPSGPTLKQVSGLASESAGRYSMFDEGQRQAQRARSTLFPNNDTTQFNRGLITRLQFRDWGATMGSADAQKLDYMFERLAEAQLRMETGAAAPTPEQIKKQKQVYMNLAADPGALYQRLVDIERSLGTAKTVMDPHGRLQKYVDESYGNTAESDSIQEQGLLLDPETGLPQGAEVLEWLD